MHWTNVYYKNLEIVRDCLLPAPDIQLVDINGNVKKVDLAISQIARHYFFNLLTLPFALAALPLTWTLSSLFGRVEFSIKHQVNHPENYTHSYGRQSSDAPLASFGFSSSGFQDSALGTSFDTSSLQGQGIADWEKLLKRDPQIVDENGGKIGPQTGGITLRKGEKIEDLFVNILDHPKEFAQLLLGLGCTAYRVSLERSVIEPQKGQINPQAIEAYKNLFSELKANGIEPWVTLHHFTNPQWFEDAGGFENEDYVHNFALHAQSMVREFKDTVAHWMTFNEPGIRGLEGYIRGEHPPEQTSIPKAAQVIRNLLVAHMKAYHEIKKEFPIVKVGITHQWLRFLPFSGNLIEEIGAQFFTDLAHTPVFGFVKNGVMEIKAPFQANVQLRYAREEEQTSRFADFIGIQAYGYPRLKIGFNNGTPYPGAADKVHNFCLPFLGIGFTAGSTCEDGDRMQYFGPPARPSDLIHVLDEAFSISAQRVPEKCITETGCDAKGMRRGENGISQDNAFQGKTAKQIIQIAGRYNLSAFFWWTLKRHCEWRSGGMPELGIADLQFKEGRFTFGKTGETPALIAICSLFLKMPRNSFFAEGAA